MPLPLRNWPPSGRTILSCSRYFGNSSFNWSCGDLENKEFSDHLLLIAAPQLSYKEVPANLKAETVPLSSPKNFMLASHMSWYNLS